MPVQSPESEARAVVHAPCPFRARDLPVAVLRERLGLHRFFVAERRDLERAGTTAREIEQSFDVARDGSVIEGRGRCAELALDEKDGSALLGPHARECRTRF